MGPCPWSLQCTVWGPPASETLRMSCSETLDAVLLDYVPWCLPPSCAELVGSEGVEKVLRIVITSGEWSSGQLTCCVRSFCRFAVQCCQQQAGIGSCLAALFGSHNRLALACRWCPAEAVAAMCFRPGEAQDVPGCAGGAAGAAAQAGGREQGRMLCTHIRAQHGRAGRPGNPGVSLTCRRSLMHP